MKTLKFYIIFLLIFFVTIILHTQENKNFSVFIGDDIIAYCYQPIDGSGLHQIYTIHADGSENQKMIYADIGLNHHNWSPDGSKMAAVGYIGTGNDTWSIHVFDTDGTNLLRLTTASNVWDNDPAWSPNGERICFTRIYPNQNYREEIWMMENLGSNQHWIGIEGASAKWSPDGTRLIYFSDKSGNYELYSCNIDGSDKQQLTNTSIGELTPVWSPDGSKIAFTRVDEDMRHDICIMDSNGQNMQCLTSESEYGGGAPKWSPDGLMIAFHSGPFEGWEIFIINVDGSDLQQVTNSPPGKTAINPDWKPDINTGIPEFIENPKSLRAYPNPFDVSTTIEYSLLEKTHVELTISNLSGKDVVTIIDEIQKPGKYSIVWYGADNAGKAVPSGIYLCKIQVDREVFSFKIVFSNKFH
nr:PD40 domain-containing protein [Bacteroidota bacterium]